MEFSLDPRWQGSGGNGSLMEDDALGVGERLGRELLAELERLGSTFVTAYIVQGVEDAFYESSASRRTPDTSCTTSTAALTHSRSTAVADFAPETTRWEHVDATEVLVQRAVAVTS